MRTDPDELGKILALSEYDWQHPRSWRRRQEAYIIKSIFA
jgi:hypothetical protein